eukprot:CCRYP_021208-RA/>CCRYP_021208-RA protein AED:0.46 eAED:0.31 QI:0/0/0/0.5/1/1/2/0/188
MTPAATTLPRLWSRAGTASSMSAFATQMPLPMAPPRATKSWNALLARNETNTSVLVTKTGATSPLVYSVDGMPCEAAAAAEKRLAAPPSLQMEQSAQRDGLIQTPAPLPCHRGAPTQCSYEEKGPTHGVEGELRMVWLLAQYNAPATIKSITARIMPPPTTKTFAGSPSLHPLTLSDICRHRKQVQTG